MPVTPASAPPGFGRIGLSDISGPMAHNLVTAGFDVAVINLRREALRDALAKGGRIADCASSLLQSCCTIDNYVAYCCDLAIAADHSSNQPRTSRWAV